MVFQFQNDDSSERMQSYSDIMTIYGKEAGIDFNFQGTIANPLDAHGLIQQLQEGRRRKDCRLAANATSLNPITSPLEDPDIFLPETKAQLREQVNYGVDVMRLVVFEERRRDFTLRGAKEAGEYFAVMEQLIKETT